MLEFLLLIIKKYSIKLRLKCVCIFNIKMRENMHKALIVN